jgi:hypothetical protein
MEEFTVGDGARLRRFPVYDDGDTTSPTGGKRKVHYELVPGEAGSVLDPERIMEERAAGGGAVAGVPPLAPITGPS